MRHPLLAKPQRGRWLVHPLCRWYGGRGELHDRTFGFVVVASISSLVQLHPLQHAHSGLGATLIFVRHITSLDAGFPRLSQAVYGVAGFGIPIALLGVAIDRSVADVFNAVYLAICPLLLLVATIQTWRRGHAVGRWLTIAYTPNAVVTVYIGLEMLQLLPAWRQSRYLMVAAVALSVPLLQQALHLRARERREVQERADALPTQDALTGLSTRPLFDTQVELAIKRFAPEPGALRHRDGGGGELQLLCVSPMATRLPSNACCVQPSNFTAYCVTWIPPAVWILPASAWCSMEWHHARNSRSAWSAWWPPA